MTAFDLMLSTRSIRIRGFLHGRGCIRSEREALMEFKAGIEDPSSFLSSWVEQGDCCTWSGVVCDNFTGHVTELHLGWPSSSSWQNSGFSGKLSPSLLELKYLSYLDLSNNNFQGIPVPSFLGSMSGLSSLYLDGAGFGGVIPHQLGNLSQLQQLGLQAGDYVMYSDSLQWISGLHSLEYLDLSNVDLSNATDWLNMVNILPTLSELFLSKCQIRYIPPVANVNLSLLSALDLYHNDFPRSSLFSWASHLHSLTYLDLGLNHFGGSFPDELQNLTSLRNLFLTSNQFNSSIPNWLYSLHNLENLTLYNNKLQGTVSNDIGNLSSLVHLDMSFNHGLEFEKGIPESFKGFCRLRFLSLPRVKLNQSVSELLDILGGCACNTLQVLSLRGSQLFGPLTDDIGKFKTLRRLILSNNSISGSLPVLFGEMTSLNHVDISRNKIIGMIPESFGMLAELTFADISQNSMKGVVFPEIHFANLSNLASFLAFDNQMVLRTKPEWVPSKHLAELDLGSCFNCLEGPLPLISSNLTFLDLSNNLLSGKLLKFLCFNPNQMKEMEFLNLQWNIPEWMGQSLPALSILSLGSNKFHGTIPEELCNLQSLQILDLSHNYLNGTLPECVANLTAMVSAAHNTSGTIHLFAGQSYSFPDSQLLVTKGQLMDYSTILNYVRSLDLSRNNLSGEIPKQITSLNALKYLNLSHNSFSGAIPEDLTEMESLECMDLSDNQLSGAIPSSLGSLTFLNHLNLSYNNLGGRIPSSTQLQSFDSSSFTGNRELCGPPLGLNCSIQSGFKDGEEDDKEFAFHWSSGSVFIGFVAGFWAVVGTFVLNQESRKTYFEFVDLMGNKLWNVLIRWLK
ncbi:Receptor-like protein EIX2 [Linum perenne]